MCCKLLKELKHGSVCVGMYEFQCSEMFKFYIESLGICKGTAEIFVCTFYIYTHLFKCL
jgi:hypothetical protein